MQRYTVGLLALSTMIACSSGSTEVTCVEGQEMSTYNEFAAKYSEIYCDVRLDCEPVDFEERFGEDAEECHRFIVKQESKRATAKLCEDNCDFNVEQAEACLEAMETLTCDGWENGSLEEMCSSMLWECDAS